MNTGVLAVFLHGQGVTDENALRIVAMITALGHIPELSELEAILGTVGENPAMAQDALDALSTIDVEVVEPEPRRGDRRERENPTPTGWGRFVEPEPRRGDRRERENPTPTGWGRFVERIDPRNWRVKGEPIKWRNLGIAAGVVVLIVGVWYFWPSSEAPENNQLPVTVTVPATPPSAIVSATPSAPTPVVEPAVQPSQGDQELADCANGLLGDPHSGYTDKNEAINACIQAAQEELAANDDKPAVQPSQGDQELADCANGLLADPSLGFTKQTAIATCLEEAQNEGAGNEVANDDPANPIDEVEGQ